VSSERSKQTIVVHKTHTSTRTLETPPPQHNRQLCDRRSRCVAERAVVAALSVHRGQAASSSPMHASFERFVFLIQQHYETIRIGIRVNRFETYVPTNRPLWRQFEPAQALRIVGALGGVEYDRGSTPPSFIFAIGVFFDFFRRFISFCALSFSITKQTFILFLTCKLLFKRYDARTTGQC
jgi:hypothetical protein